MIDDRVQFREEHKKLLAAQVVLTDRLDRLAIRVDELTEAGKHTDQRLNALIKVVDDLVRRQQCKIRLSRLSPHPDVHDPRGHDRPLIPRMPELHVHPAPQVRGLRASTRPSSTR